MSMAFKIDEDHNGTGQEKKDEMLNKEPLPIIKKGDAPICKSQNITKEKLQKFMPRGTNARVTDEILEMIRNIENDTGLHQEYAEERVMSCIHLMGKQGVTLEKLVNAVKFCTLKQHMTNKKAWSITFPDEYDRVMAKGGEVDTHVAMFNATYLVIEIDKMMIVPFHLLYNKIKHEALEVQVNLMRGIGANDDDRVTPHIQHLAAKTVSEILKSPEENSIELKIGASDAVLAQQQELNDHLAEIVANQRKAFQQGKDVSELQRIHVKNEGRNYEEPEEIIYDEDED